MPCPHSGGGGFRLSGLVVVNWATLQKVCSIGGTMETDAAMVLAPGAMSMAAGEYISVASQRDTEQADVDKERLAQESGPAIRQQELEELAQIYVERGLTERLAREVAVALTEKDAVRAHARVCCSPLLSLTLHLTSFQHSRALLLTGILNQAAATCGSESNWALHKRCLCVSS